MKVAEYNTICRTMRHHTYDKQFAMDLAHDYVVKKLENKKICYFWQFVHRYERGYYGIKGVVRLICNTGKPEDRNIPPQLTTVTNNTNITLKMLVSQVIPQLHGNTTKSGPRILDLYLQGYNYREIGAIVGCKKQQAHRFMVKLTKVCQTIAKEENGDL